MAYFNGKDILPEELFLQVQNYCEGNVIYIPRKAGARRRWGYNTGICRELDKRNRLIREKKQQGCSMKELAKEFHLSVDSLKKILYSAHAE